MIRRREFLAAAACLAIADKAGSAPAGAFSQIAEGVYVRAGAVELMSAENRGAIANIGFVVGRDAVAMIDSGGSIEDGTAALAAIRAVTDRPVRYLVNTHMHPDHLFGNQVFKAAGAEIIGQAHLPAALDARRDTYLQTMRGELGEAIVSKIAILAPDTTVADTRVIDLGGRRLLLKAWGTAHTDNDLTVFDETTATLFAGDLVFVDHVPIIDGSLLGWLKQLDALRAVPAKRVVPGHGPASADWPSALDAETTYLNNLAGDIRAAIRDGRTLSEATGTAGAGEAGKWSLFADYNPRNASAAFAELEWE